MRISRRIRIKQRDRQSGYVLIILLVAVALMAIALTQTAPRIAQDIQREREEEMMNRAEEYVKAVRKYYRKFGRYPNRIEELENTNNMRFLRKRFKDPMTEDGEWNLVRFGQVRFPKRPVSGPGGQVGTPVSQMAGAAGSQPQQAGTPASQISRPAGTGQTLGGAPIVGVVSKSKKTGIKEYNQKQQYSDWEFYYDPSQDPYAAQAQPQPATPGGQRPTRGPGPGNLGPPPNTAPPPNTGPR